MFVEPERRLDRADVVLLSLENPLRRRFHSKRVSSNAIEQTVEWVQCEIRFRVSQGRNRQLKCSAFDVFRSSEQKASRLSYATGLRRRNGDRLAPDSVFVSGAVCCYSFAKTFGLKAALRLHIQ